MLTSTSSSKTSIEASCTTQNSSANQNDVPFSSYSLGLPTPISSPPKQSWDKSGTRCETLANAQPPSSISFSLPRSKTRSPCASVNLTSVRLQMPPQPTLTVL